MQNRVWKQSSERLLTHERPLRYVWLLPSLPLGLVLIFWFSRIHKYSRTPRGAMAGPCLSTSVTVWTHRCRSVWFKLRKSLVEQQVQTAVVGPLLCQNATCCPHSPCAWRKPWMTLLPHQMSSKERYSSGSATSYQSCSTQLPTEARILPTLQMGILKSQWPRRALN